MNRLNNLTEVKQKACDHLVYAIIRDVEAEAGSGSGGSGPFSVEADAEARKFHRFRFHIGGKIGGKKEIGSDILRRRAKRGSINT